MATSGVTTWQLGRDSIISAALRKIAAISKGQAIDTQDTANGTEALNAMLKSFQVKGMPLWAIKETIFTLAATKDYYIGISQILNTPAPLKVIQATLLDTLTETSTPLELKTHYDYNLLPRTDDTGSPIALWYEPRNQTGIMHIWPIPDDYSIENRQIRITYQRPFEDMVASTDSLDFPQYWHEAVIYGLAWRLAPEYGVPLNDTTSLEKVALYHLEEALSFGTEEGSIFFQPDRGP